MSFLRTVSEHEATGDVADMYEGDIEKEGFLPNYTRTFSLHPEAYRAWRHLIAAVAKPMDDRRYELSTVGAASRLRSTYCSLAHGEILSEDHLEPSVVVRIVENPDQLPLDEVDARVFQFARKVAADATSVTEADIEGLRSAGLSEKEIFEVVLAAAARSFFTKVIDATGTLADSVYNEMDPELREALTVGRPIAQ